MASSDTSATRSSPSQPEGAGDARSASGRRASLQKNANGTLAPSGPDGNELLAAPARRDRQIASEMGLSLSSIPRQTDLKGRLAVRVLFKSWRSKDDALALYVLAEGGEALAGKEEERFRVLIFPADDSSYFASDERGSEHGEIDLRYVAVGSRLQVRLDQSESGWPLLTSAKLGRPGAHIERPSSPAIPFRQKHLAGEKRRGIGGKAGTDVKVQVIRLGLWTYVKDGRTRGVQFAGGARVPEREIRAARREQLACEWHQHGTEGSEGGMEVGAIAERLEVSESAVKGYLRRGDAMRERGYAPGARPDRGLTGADVRAYVRFIEDGQTPHRIVAETDREPVFLLETEKGTEGPYPAGHPRLAARHVEPGAHLLRSTGLRDRAGRRIFERDEVRAGEGMPDMTVWWSQRHLRWQAGDAYSLAQLDGLARNYFGREGLERVGGQRAVAAE